MKGQRDLFGPDGETIEVYRCMPRSVRECTAACCRRRVEWVLTPAGRWMPLDAPVRPIREFEAQDGRILSVVFSASSHFVTCPEAASFRRSRAGRRR